jgi:hypothetical protein
MGHPLLGVGNAFHRLRKALLPFSLRHNLSNKPYREDIYAS